MSYPSVFTTPLLLLCALALTACQHSPQQKKVSPLIHQQAQWELLQFLKHPERAGMDGVVYLKMDVNRYGYAKNCEIRPLLPTKQIPNPPPANPTLEAYVLSQCQTFRFSPMLTAVMLGKKKSIPMTAPLIFKSNILPKVKPAPAQPSSQ